MSRMTLGSLLIVTLFIPSILHAIQEETQYIEGPVDDMYFVSIPAGSFQMGSPSSERGRLEAEGPVHTVTLSSFEIMATEVLQGMWEEVMGTTVSDLAELSNFADNARYDRTGSDVPMYYVNYYDCIEFIAVLNELDSAYVYRLPSESEWEYACRAGTSTPFYWGVSNTTSMVAEYCWCASTTNNMNAHPAASLSPNIWGLCDMSGNVWEWCADWWNDSYTNWSGAPTDGSAWTQGDFSSMHIIRGGSSVNDAVNCRSAQRHAMDNSERHNTIGFRVVRESAIAVNAELLLIDGYAALDSEDYSLALSCFNQSVELVPEYIEALYMQGYANCMCENYLDAVKSFNVVIELKPGEAWAYDQRSQAYRMLEQYDNAISDLTIAIELEPEFARPYAQRGFVYCILEQYDQSISDYTKAIELDPEYAWAYEERGIAYNKVEQYDQAVLDFTRAIELDPDDYGTQYNLACAYALLGDARSAIEALELAVSLGYSNLAWMEEDSDFDQIRDESAFQEGMEGIRELLGSQ